MRKIYETILGLVSSAVIFFSPAEARKSSSSSPDYHIPDTPKISSLDQVELLPTPPPLILRQTDLDTDDTFAAHRSHSSHRSHASHASHYSGAGSTSKPKEEEKTPAKAITPSDSTKKSPQSKTDAGVADKEWRTSTEWMKEPCKLYLREVFIILNSEGNSSGVVTECNDAAIEITNKSKNAKEWIQLKDVKGLAWR